MKRTKILSLLLSLGTIASGAVLVPLTSCSKKSDDTQKTHIKLFNDQEKEKITGDNEIAIYHLVLTNSSDTNLTITMEGDAKSNFEVTTTQENADVYVSVKYTGALLSVDKAFTFSLKVVHSSWNTTIDGLKITVKGKSEVTALNAINDVLASADKPATMSGLIALLALNDIDLEIQTTESASTQWVWDSENNVVFTMNQDGTVYVAPRGYTINQNKANIWKMVNATSSNIGTKKDEYSSTSQYSQYLRSDQTFGSSLTFCSGLDTGVHTGFDLTFKKDETLASTTPAVLYTNESSLKVESSLDSISHYGHLSTLTIESLPENKEYNEFGTVDLRTIIKSGSIVAKENSKFNDIVIESNNVKKIIAEADSTIGSVKRDESVTNDTSTFVEVKTGAVQPEIIAEKQTPADLARYVAGAGTANSPYAVATAQQLLNCKEDVNEKGKANNHFILASDIDMNGQTFTSIGTSGVPFTGCFDGKGYTISNLTIVSSTDHTGLFGFTKNEKYNTAFNEPKAVWDFNKNEIIAETVSEENYATVIKNITLKNINYSLSANKKYTGGIVGEAINTLIDNCSVESGTINGYKCVGGICGSMKGATISNCSTGNGLALSSGTGYNIGGICGTPGYNYGKYTEKSGEAIISCSNNASIECTPSNESSGGYLGGIAGYISTPRSGAEAEVGCIIDNCVNYGTLTSGSTSTLNTCIGGIAGCSNNLFVISNSTNNGAIISEQDIGSKEAYIAGITEGANLRIFNSKNTGSITVKKATEVAGVFANEGGQGQTLELISCSNTGTLTNTDTPTAVHDLAASIKDVILTDVEYPNVHALNAAIASSSSNVVSLKMTNVRVTDTSDEPLCFGTKMYNIESDRKICDTIKVDQNTAYNSLIISLPGCNVTIDSDCSNCYFVQNGADSTVTITQNGKLNNVIVTGANSKIINNGAVTNAIGIDGAAAEGENNGTCGILSLGSNSAPGTVDKHFVNNGTIHYSDGSGTHHVVNSDGASTCNIVLDNYGTIQHTKASADNTYLFCIYNIGTRTINCFENSKVITNYDDGYAFAAASVYPITLNYKQGATYKSSSDPSEKSWGDKSFSGVTINLLP